MKYFMSAFLAFVRPHSTQKDMLHHARVIVPDFQIGYALGVRYSPPEPFSNSSTLLLNERSLRRSVT